MDRSYTQRGKPAKGGVRGLDDRKETTGKDTERSVVCGIKEKAGEQERVENVEVNKLPNGITQTTKIQ